MSIILFNSIVYFDEYANALYQTLKSRYPVIFATSFPLPPAKLVIMFGLLSTLVPAPTIPYIAVQLEQRTSQFFTPGYIEKLRGAVEVWDFCKLNLPFLAQHGIMARYMPLGRIDLPLFPLTSEIYDVLFLGVLNAHRKETLDYLRSNGIVVHSDDQIFRDRKDELIGKCRILLNLHYYPEAGLEQLRIVPALNRGKLVISERGMDDLNCAEFAQTPEEFLTQCRCWLGVSPEERRVRALELLEQVPLFEELIPWDVLASLIEEKGEKMR